MELDQKTFEELKAKHPRAVALSAAGHDFVFIPPSPAEWKRFRETSAGEPRSSSGAAETLVKVCMVFPSKEEYAAILNDFPGIATNTLFPEVAQLAGAGVAVEKKTF